MGRLHCIILRTPDLDRQRSYYETQLGLTVAHAEAQELVFATRGAALVLQPAAEGERAELQLAITTTGLAARMSALQGKGIVFEGEVVETPACRMAVLRDPEGNRVQLMEPLRPLEEARWPLVSHAIISAAKFDDTLAFYRETMGLKVAEESERWVEFETGETRLTIHDRDDKVTLALHPDQRVTFAIEDADFEVWAEELRGRGVTFVSAPMEEMLGLQAEVEDADGWFVVLHGPAPDDQKEDALAADFDLDDDDEPTRGQVRRAGEMGGDAAKRPGFNPAKVARKQAAKAGSKSFETVQRNDADRGGYVPPTRPSYGGSRPSGPSRPYTPRPEGSGPPRPFTPRPEGSPPSRPYTPRPEGSPPSRPYTPRPEGSGPPRPYTPRPEGSGPPRPRPEGSGPSRPYTPRPEGSGPPRPSGPRPDSSRPGGSSAPRRPSAPPRPDREDPS